MRMLTVKINRIFRRRYKYIYFSNEHAVLVIKVILNLHEVKRDLRLSVYTLKQRAIIKTAQIIVTSFFTPTARYACWVLTNCMLGPDELYVVSKFEKFCYLHELEVMSCSPRQYVRIRAQDISCTFAFVFLQIHRVKKSTILQLLKTQYEM